MVDGAGGPEARCNATRVHHRADMFLKDYMDRAEHLGVLPVVIFRDVALYLHHLFVLRARDGRVRSGAAAVPVSAATF